MTSLAHFLLGQSRSAVLSALLLRPEAALHVRELARLTNVSPGSLHRELRNLADLGLLLRQETGRQVFYRANLKCPIFEELAGLLRKTAGLVDVMLVGDLDFADVVLALSGAQEFLRREINPVVLTRAEWDRKLAQADGFAAQVWQGDKLWLVGQA